MTLFQVFQATATATATAMTEVQQGLDAATNEVGIYNGFVTDADKRQTLAEATLQSGKLFSNFCSLLLAVLLTLSLPVRPYVRPCSLDSTHSRMYIALIVSVYTFPLFLVHGGTTYTHHPLSSATVC